MKELRSYLVEHATPGEWTLDAGSTTDRSKEDMALEIVREKVFQRFYDGGSGGLGLEDPGIPSREAP